MENTTPLSAPASSHPARSKKLLLIIGGLIVLAALVAWYVNAVPVRLMGLKVFEGDYLQGKVLSFGIAGLQEKQVAGGGVVADYASAKGTTIALVRNADTNATDIVLVSDKGRPLTSDGVGKAALAVSPDGGMIAYAALTNAPEGTYFTPQFGAWTIHMMDVKTGEVTLMGPGFGPEFFNAEGKLMLLFTGAIGITVADVAAKTSQTTFFLNPGVIDYAAHMSDDGKFIAIPNGLTKHYEFFSITRLSAPIGLDPLGSAEPVLIHGDFKGSSFYGIERVADGAPRLWRFSVAKPLVAERVFDLPAQSLYRIIP